MAPFIFWKLFLHNYMDSTYSMIRQTNTVYHFEYFHDARGSLDKIKK